MLLSSLCTRFKSKRTLYLRHLLQSTVIFIALTIFGVVGLLLNLKFLIAPFGASLAIVLCFSESPFSKPKNIIGGYVITSFIGVCAYHVLGDHTWSLALAVSFSIFLMLVFEMMHPPAAAVTIITLTTATGWLYIIFPVLIGAIVLAVIGVLERRHIQKVYCRICGTRSERDAPKNKNLSRKPVDCRN